MKNLYIILLLVSLVSNAQDVDVYKHHKNSNFEIPDIPKGMTYEEFEILSTDLRMQDMAMAVVFPGHVHFKIGEKKTGYILLGARLAGYAGWTYLAINDESLSGIVLTDNLDIETDVSTGDEIVAYSSIALMLGSYLYDWIHGKYKLDEKQNSIRYKYAKKKVQLSLSDIRANNRIFPGVALTYKF